VQDALGHKHPEPTGSWMWTPGQAEPSLQLVSSSVRDSAEVSLRTLIVKWGAAALSWGVGQWADGLRDWRHLRVSLVLGR
jgi:hypothetical protein